jgi:hypothetical protein
MVHWKCHSRTMPDQAALFADRRHDSGGKVRIRLKPGVSGSATFAGPGDCYRLRLERRSRAFERTVGFCWMNPSCAGAHWDDPTVAKGWRYATAWDFGRMLVVNSYAYCRTDQTMLHEVADPVGPGNDDAILSAALECDLFVMGYGTPRLPELRARGPAVARMLRAAGIPLHVHALSRDGVPIHPRMHPERVPPVLWEGPDA